MGNRGALDLMGPTERQILQILWRDGPTSVRHIQALLGAASSVAVTSPLQSLQHKGFVTRTRIGLEYQYHALPKQALLVLTCERHLAKLGATPAERAHVVEALRHG
jgi:predicted transcriptional regulator